jgi:hypothetical protein
MGHVRRWLAGTLLVVCAGGLVPLTASVVDAKGGSVPPSRTGPVASSSTAWRY